MLVRVLRYLPELAAFAVLAAIQLHMGRWALESLRRRGLVQWLAAARVAILLSCLLLASGLLLSISGTARLFPPGDWIFWARGAAIAWGVCLACVYGPLLLLRRLRLLDPEYHPERRRLLVAMRSAIIGAPLAVTGYGLFIERSHFGVREIDIRIPDLHKDLDQVRLVQLSDIHLSPFLSERELETVVAMANETRAHVALVTGDLISVRSDDLDACLQHLSRLRADAGIVGCLGNHEIYAQAEAYAAEEGARRGIDFLRQRARVWRFGDALVNFGGVDYQRSRRPYLAGAEALINHDRGSINVLLSHNPDVFPIAAHQGWDFTIAGHTHGGQISVEILHERINPARFFTPFTYGLYRRDRAQMYVTRGIGTVGVPARIGAPPEIALLRLCAI